jgi:hypothetical protein
MNKWSKYKKETIQILEENMSAGKITLMTRNPIKDRLKAIKEDRYI